MKSMEEQGLGPYEREAVTRTNWDLYSKRFAEFIDALKQRGDI